ncbi:MAG: hypothetical protein M5R40_04830 [Anaerolineae bacterium]|nr:hypothetical protein [Anaerolineae bacterium]
MSRHLVIVPHTHWPREGYAPFEVLRRRLVRAVDDLLDAMEAPGGLPAFLFGGQSAPALDYLAASPGSQPRVRALVESGRLAVGPWHVLPDEFLVSQESLIRNLARGLADAERLGGAMPVAYLADAFGHTGQMPQILRGFGLDVAVVWRGAPSAITRSEFWWQAPDGSQVMAIYLPFGYTLGARLPVDTDALAARLQEIAAQMAPWASTPNVLVLSGDDHAPAPLEIVAALERLRLRKAAAPAFVEGDAVQDYPERSFDWEIGRLTDYVALMRDALQGGELPAHVGEMRESRRAPVQSGVASARAPLKLLDFIATRQMEARVEPLAAWCALYGLPVDRHLHGRVWNLLLRNQSHYSIAGCVGDEVQYDLEQRYLRARQLMDVLVGEYLEALARRWPVPEPPAQTIAQIAAFNATGPRAAEVCEGLFYADTRVRSAELRDRTGVQADAQIEYLGEEVIRTQTLTPDALLAMLAPTQSLGPVMGFHVQKGHFRRQEDGSAVFTLVLGPQPNPHLDLLPAARAFLDAHPEVVKVVLRYTRGHAHRVTFTQQSVAPGKVSAFTMVRSLAAAPASELTADDRMLTNAYYRLTWDGESLRLFDRRSGRRFGPLNVFADEGDRGDLFTFCPLPGDAPVPRPDTAKAEVIAEGPVYAAWRVRYTYELPVGLTADRYSRLSETFPLAIETIVRLYAGIDRIDFTTRLRNRARDHRLRVGMFSPIATENVWCDGQFELIRRPIALPPHDQSWAELPQPTHTINGFAALSDNQNTLLLMTRGLREVEAAPAEEGVALWLTLLRCVGQLSWHDLETRPAGAQGPSLPTPEAQLLGVHAFEYSLSVLPEPITRATLWDRLAAYQAPSIVTQVWPGGGDLPPSMAVSDPDIEWSAFKPADAADAVILRLVNKRVSPKPGVRFWPGPAVRAVYEADLREQPAEAALPMTDGAVVLDFAPYQIRTLYLELSG